jgi:hypothetical protein
MIPIPPQILGFLQKWWPAIAGATLLGMLLTLAYCEGRSTGKRSEIVKQQDREIETQRDLNTANESAASARVDQVVRAMQQEKELTDALEKADDPDHRRVLRGCIILRQQGRDIADIPACR